MQYHSALRRIPRCMLEAPALDPALRTSAPRPRSALLINPFYCKDAHGSFGKHVLTPSLALTSIAAATPPEWEIGYWDENLLQGPPPSAPFPQVVGITVHLTFARRAYELAAWYRARGAKVILGGLHVMSCPEEAAAHADAVALGDGAVLWPRILGDVERGCLRARYDAGFTRSFAENPVPRRDILPVGDFLTTASLIATRGCHNRCSFCYLATQGVAMPRQARRPADVAEEFGAQRQPYGVFIDNNLGANPAYLLELCRALAPLGKIWSAAVTLDVTDHPGLVREMALAGCNGVFIGFETLNAENLKDARKRCPLPDDYARRIEIFRSCGIQVNGSFVLGFDHDGPEVFRELTDWIERVRLPSATFHILTPYPGTPLFARLEQEGRLLHRNWDLYDTAHVVFRPKRMSAAELEQGYDWCYSRTFSHSSIWLRRPRPLNEALPYLALTYLYKRSNRIWPFLIRHHLTHTVWRPFVELSRLGQMRRRRRLQHESGTGAALRTTECPSTAEAPV